MSNDVRIKGKKRDGGPTRQFLHFHTKLASPLDPESSFNSYAQLKVRTHALHSWLCNSGKSKSKKQKQKQKETYKTADTNSVGMDLSTRCAPHLEHVVEPAFFRVVWPEVSHPTAKKGQAINISCRFRHIKKRRKDFDGWIYPDISAVSVSAYMSVECIAITLRRCIYPSASMISPCLELDSNYVILRGR